MLASLSARGSKASSACWERAPKVPQTRPQRLEERKETRQAAGGELAVDSPRLPLPNVPTEKPGAWRPAFY